MIVKQVETVEELHQILQLQQANHVSNVPADKKQTDGFVTLENTIESLTEMNNKVPQIIAVENGWVVGYALIMLREHCNLLPILTPLYNALDEITYKGNILSEYSYYIMGQVCVADSHKGQGVFRKLYEKHKELLSGRFDICVTEVSSYNPRSLNAHQRMGFNIVKNYQDDTGDWNIVVWDWMKRNDTQKG